MSFRKYTDHEFSDIKHQYNIMALVGNGFDLQVMRDYQTESDTSYRTFYHYLMFRRFDRTNRIVREMEVLKDTGADNWSDVENAIGNLVASGGVDPGDVYASLRPIQAEFSNFLNTVVSRSILDKLGRDAMEKGWGVRSLSMFIGDMTDDEDFSNFKFQSATNHYDLLNFLFVNFNYTPLLDDYLYLDQDQFDPKPYWTVDRNFTFYPNPNGKQAGKWDNETRLSSYITTDVVHPHGYQDIPRSLLFGIDGQKGAGSKADPIRKLKKPFWAQNDLKFSHLFRDTRLFVVFGCSLGQTDGWWWRSILEELKETEAELLIYKWYPGDLPSEATLDVKIEFLKAASCTLDNAKKNGAADKIYVIPYNDESHRVWLSTKKDSDGPH